MKPTSWTSIVFVIGVLAMPALVTPAGATSPEDLVEAANERTEYRVRYDGSYQVIAYPMGDVADNKGVCSDVIIRSYRSLGIDLQELVHEDMKEDFSSYPNHWNLSAPDTNIDHRRVPNLQTFFSVHGDDLPISQDPDDYSPGDLVTWVVGGNLPHIGIVTDRKSASGAPMIVHNIGRGPELEDMLFAYTITGHYSYLPENP